jgi:hypothetical protein
MIDERKTGPAVMKIEDRKKTQRPKLAAAMQPKVPPILASRFEYMTPEPKCKRNLGNSTMLMLVSTMIPTDNNARTASDDFSLSKRRRKKKKTK